MQQTLITLCGRFDGLKCARGATSILYGFPFAAHPEVRQSAEEHPGCYAHGVAQDKAHLDLV